MRNHCIKWPYKVIKKAEMLITLNNIYKYYNNNKNDNKGINKGYLFNKINVKKNRNGYNIKLIKKSLLKKGKKY